jgi:hypothetical protein
MEFAAGELRCQNPAGMPDFGMRKGLKRYPFLPEAKKIQAQSPVPGGAGDAPKTPKIRRIPVRLSW